ncbi:class I/II aminotransferase [Helicosporidium sp. ATCC 50920]|nr:class I/II aminotransferase [Helicosporidium sp. ATCC 50920]|eukprot:KDD76320.1 class I/II aminotransferase [Helicosporidium sp. ATCC 50920]
MARGRNHDEFLVPPFMTAIVTYICWTTLYIVGKLRDMARKLVEGEKRPGYAPIRQDYEDFYTRRMYYRIHDCFNRPICSAPGSWVDVMLRTPPSRQRALTSTGETRSCLNLGSYNYLGFASTDEYCTPQVLDSLDSCGWWTGSARGAAGTTRAHQDLERELAGFLGTEDALVCGMGFATNSHFLPLLAGPGCLLISDALNHASIVTGARASGAKVRVFRHNDAEHLRQVLRDAVVEGQPRVRRPWRKILVVIEGIYSMEGEVCNLAEIVRVAKEHRAYVYLDEAHSIGAMGATGRGVCEHLGVDVRDVDVMMGTFTKSFGSVGGYLAGRKELVDYLRMQSPAALHAGSMSPPAAAMALAALRLVMDADGSGRGPAKLRALKRNSNYFREGLLRAGLSVLGDWDSPVMPVMAYQPTKLAVAGRYTLAHNVAVVAVGFPATPLLTSRLRVCISAAHTREDLDYGLRVLAEVAKEGHLFFRPHRAKKVAAERKAWREDRGLGAYE